MRPIPKSAALIATVAVAVAGLASSAAVSAAPQAKDANGANPTDIAASDAAGGAIIDKTRPAGGASAAATSDMRSMQGAKQAASAAGDGRKRRPTPVARGASSAM